MIRVNSSHTGHYAADASAVTRVIGYLGVVVWLFAAVLLAFAARGRSSLGNLAHRLAAYAFLLVFLYPVAMLNRFVWTRPGEECLVSLSLVALNALVWMTALVEVIAYYLRYDGAPAHWTSYDTLTVAVKVLVAALAVVSTADESTRYVAVLLIVPIVAVLTLAATREAGEQRAIHTGAAPRSWRTVSRPRRVFLALAVVGLYAFVVEILSPALTCAIGVAVSVVFMTVEHLALGAFLVYIAYGTSDDSSTATTPAATTAVSPSLLRSDDTGTAATAVASGELVSWEM
jgi:hypothetical protein